MRGPRSLLRFILARLDRRALGRDMDEEMAVHIAMHAESLERQGLAPDEAARRARAEFGGVQQYREAGRDARAFSWLHDFVADVRYGTRALVRAPGFAIICVASLGLGIGANTAIFGVLYGVLMQPLAIPHARELVVVGVTMQGDTYTSMRRDDYLALRGAPGLPRLEAVNEANDIAIVANGTTEFLPINYVEGGFFDLLDVRPTIGRTITADDDRSNSPVAVISDAMWSRFFARDVNAVGKKLLIRGEPFTVIGVMPPSFHGVRFNGRFGLAVPQSAFATLGTPAALRYVAILARIDVSTSRAALSARLDPALHRCCLNARETDADTRHAAFLDASRGIPFGKDDFRGDYELVLIVLMGGVFLVLLIACSNVGNLLLARAAARERELSIRLSIGASRSRLVRQLLAESAVLAALGAAAGLGLAAIGTRLLVDALPRNMSSAVALVEFQPKPAILGFTAAVALLCVFAFGLGPALRATRGDLVGSLKERAGGRARRSKAIDRMLVVGQVAVTVVLVCGATLLVATLRNLRSTDPGFVQDRMLAVTIETRGTGFERNGITPIFGDILERVRRVPGVQSAGMATRVPSVGGRNINVGYAVMGDQNQLKDQSLDVTAVSPGYFATTQTALRAGRDFAASDVAGGEHVAIVNEAFVRAHFSGRQPMGGQVRVEIAGGETVTIVGIARDVRLGDRRTPPDPMLYVPATQAGQWPFLVLLVRTAVDPRSITSALDRAIGSFSHDLRLREWTTMAAAFDEVLLRERLAAGLASLCAVLALGLAMVGLSGLVGYSVARRTREIGVRMALGARGAEVVWMILRGAVVLVVAGIAVGAPLALGTNRALSSLLYGIGGGNVVVFAGTALALVATGALASAWPAWRASRVDPVTALRAD